MARVSYHLATDAAPVVAAAAVAAATTTTTTTATATTRASADAHAATVAANVAAAAAVVLPSLAYRETYGPLPPLTLPLFPLKVLSPLEEVEVEVEVKVAAKEQALGRRADTLGGKGRRGEEGRRGEGGEGEGGEEIQGTHEFDGIPPSLLKYATAVMEKKEKEKKV
jgi:hypothetical protein